uniref:Uncharacterized protein n=1 Tax=Rhizophora mucronata TaxID=61149 RepID=A0A2P2LFG2_RHIMU
MSMLSFTGLFVPEVSHMLLLLLYHNLQQGTACHILEAITILNQGTTNCCIYILTVFFRVLGQSLY